MWNQQRLATIGIVQHANNIQSTVHKIFSKLFTCFLVTSC